MELRGIDVFNCFSAVRLNFSFLQNKEPVQNTNLPSPVRFGIQRMSTRPIQQDNSNPRE